MGRFGLPGILGDAIIAQTSNSAAMTVGHKKARVVSAPGRLVIER